MGVDADRYFTLLHPAIQEAVMGGCWEDATVLLGDGGYLDTSTWLPEPIASLTLPTSYAQNEVAARDAAETRVFVEERRTKLLDWFCVTADAASSTTVESLFPSAKEVIRTYATRHGKSAAQQAVDNLRAVQVALEIGAAREPITLEHVSQLQSVIASGIPDYKDVPGEMRATQVHVGRRYHPPQAGRLRDLMDDLLAFVNRNDVEPAHHVAVAHARFEEIHPFRCGNGRTGRALVHAMLGKHGLATQERCLPLSAHMAQHRDSYFEALNRFRTEVPLADAPGAVAPVIEVFSKSIQEGLALGRELRDGLDAVTQQWSSVRVAREGSLASKVMAHDLFRCPAVTVAQVAGRYDVTERAARAALSRLASARVVRRAKSGRVRVYEAGAMVDVFEDTLSDVLRAHASDDMVDVWGDFHADTAAPPLGRPPRAQRNTADASSVSPPAVTMLCGHPMHGGRKRCLLAAGHAGHHRSKLPWRRR